MKEFQKQLDRIEAIVTKLDDRQDRMEVVQAKQEVTLASQADSLAEHIKRTALLEDEIKPVKAHVTKVNLIFRGLIAIGTVAVGIVEIWSALGGPHP